MNHVVPDWPASPRVKSLVTTAQFGNLARHAGDTSSVEINRARLSAVGLPRQPAWLEQVHGARAIEVAGSLEHVPQADAAFTHVANVPLAIMVADCVPILISSLDGRWISTVHAGWRGLAAHVIAKTVNNYPSPDQLIAWLGPAIGPCHYEVDGAVRLEFSDSIGFVAGVDTAHWMMDLYAIAKQQLVDCGIRSIFGGGFCTYCDTRFFSHRRDANSGRFAAVIWIED